MRFAISEAERGRVIAIPGAMNWLSTITAKLAPRGLTRRMAARVGLRYIGFGDDVLGN